MPDYGAALTPEIKSAEKTLRGKKAVTALPRRKQEVLQAMCQARHLQFDGATREMLAMRLIAWVSSPRFPRGNHDDLHTSMAAGGPTPRALAGQACELFVFASPIVVGLSITTTIDTRPGFQRRIGRGEFLGGDNEHSISPDGRRPNHTQSSARGLRVRAHVYPPDLSFNTKPDRFR